MKKYLLALIVFPTFVFGQNTELAPSLEAESNQGGMFSVGVRSTLSAFNGHEDESPGLGVGGQFRIQFADRVNSDWFFDYITTDIGDYAKRTDYHIGWSVIYYFTDKPAPKLKPYILAGHCFDHTVVEDNNNRLNKLDRWSSAVQAGAGVHLNLSPKLDLSFVAQYMLHLGNEIHAEQELGIVNFEEGNGASLEGHMLFHVGINYKIGKLWKK
jgi:hypothetical protein